jgi:hypothetical protein
MATDSRIGRRELLGSTVVLGAAALTGCSETGSVVPSIDASTSPFVDRAKPLAQDYTVAARVPADGRFYYMHDPGMSRLPSGAILVAAPCLERPERTSFDVVGWQTFVSRSSDGGKTFSTVATLPYSDATPFVLGGRLHMFVQKKKWEDVLLTTSDDEGATWREPVALFRGSYWNCHTAMVEENGRLYWALQTRDYRGGVVVIAGDTRKDLLDPASWTMSSEALHPETPAALVSGRNKTAEDWWLEPNVVSVRGRMRVFLRTILDGYAATSLAAVCDLTLGEGGAMALAFSHFAAVPGAQNKCFVLRDEPSRLFWMLSNLAADSEGVVFDWDEVRRTGGFLAGPGNDRRFLALSYSVDALNWFPAGCVARTSDLHQSFMYPAAGVDGDDLVLISRTSVHGRDQHDADLVTFHRVRGFRALAMDLAPR